MSPTQDGLPQWRKVDEPNGKNRIQKSDGGRIVRNNCVGREYSKEVRRGRAADRRTIPCDTERGQDKRFAVGEEAWCSGAGSRCDSNRRINVLLVMCKELKGKR